MIATGARLHDVELVAPVAFGDDDCARRSGERTRFASKRLERGRREQPEDVAVPEQLDDLDRRVRAPVGAGDRTDLGADTTTASTSAMPAPAHRGDRIATMSGTLRLPNMSIVVSLASASENAWHKQTQVGDALQQRATRDEQQRARRHR